MFIVNGLFICIRTTTVGILNKIHKCRQYLLSNSVETDLIEVDSSSDTINSNYIIENIVYTDDTIELVKKKIDNEDCSICLENYKETHTDKYITILKCDHVFHSECIDEWIRFNGNNARCPLCKDKISNMKKLGLSDTSI